MNLDAACETVLKQSRADSCIVFAEEATAANLRWANTTPTTNGSSHEQSLTVISIIKRGVGSVTTTLNQSTNLTKLVRAAETAARTQPAAVDYAPLLKAEAKPLRRLTFDAAADARELNKLRPSLGRVFAAARRDQLDLFGYGEHNQANHYLATSSGLRKSHAQADGFFSLNAKSSDRTRSVWAGQASKDFGRIKPAAIYADLKQQMEWSQAQLTLKPGKYEVILNPTAVADLMIYLYWTATAREADEGRNVFRGKLGQPIADSRVNLYSDPAEPGLEVPDFAVAVASSSYESVFDNGLDLAKTYWLREGKLENLITPRFWATKNKYPQPVPFINNLVFSAPEGPSTTEMVKRTKRGLLVNCLWYIREVDPQRLLLTGLTRDGVFLVEDGQVKGSVNNFRFNVSPVEILNQILEIGQSVPAFSREWGDYLPNTQMPALRIADFNMSSISPAI